MLAWLGLRRGIRQLSAARAYQQVARRLQLNADTRGVSIHGHVAGRRLWIGEVMTGFGSQRSRQVRGVLDMERPLGLGLYVLPRGRRSRWLPRMRSPAQVTGDPELDRRVRVYADDDDAIRRLLSPDVKQRLRELVGRWPDLEVTDQDIRITLRSAETNPRRLLSLVDGMMALARALESSRRQIPAPDAVADLVEAWRSLADRLGLQLEDWLPAMTGRYRERRARCTLRREADGHVADLWVGFEDHADAGLRISPQEEPDGYWSVGQDIQVGHPRFDAAFVIKAWDPSVARDLLTDPVRAGLLDLVEHGAVELDGRGLTVSGLDPEGDLRGLLDRADDVAESLGW